ncbi:hypothetical protein Bca4012_102873 [Brassica carinata]
MISSRPVSSFDDQVEVMPRVSSVPRFQIRRFCSILRRKSKNCLAAKGGSVQISPSRPVSVFIIKPRVYLSRDQFSPVQSRRSSWVLAKSSPINQLLLA